MDKSLLTIIYHIKHLTTTVIYVIYDVSVEEKMKNHSSTKHLSLSYNSVVRSYLKNSPFFTSQEN